MSVIEYGTGKTRRRRPSWLAAFALLIPCVLALVAGVWYAFYQSPPPPRSGFDGLGWLLGVWGLFYLLLIGTYLGTPLSLVLAIVSLVVIRQNPARLVGRKPALLAIVMDILLLIAVGTAHYRVYQYMQTVQRQWKANLSPEAQTSSQRNDIQSLALDCNLYASEHEGDYPPDTSSLHDFLVARDKASAPELENYFYCGSGLKDKYVNQFDPTQPRLGNSLIVLVRRRPVMDGWSVIAMKDYSGQSFGVSVLTTSLPGYFDRYNYARKNLGLAPINFAAISPATQPTTQSNSGSVN